MKNSYIYCTNLIAIVNRKKYKVKRDLLKQKNEKEKEKKNYGN